MSNSKKGDAFNTEQEVKKGLRPPVNGKNWLGHGVGNGTYNIDEMLLKGATMAELVEKAERGAVEEHLGHLKRDHGLTILTEEDGTLRFASKQQPKKR